MGGPGEPGNVASCQVQGKISDSSNAEALAGAVIEVVELKRTVYASFDGTFAMSDLAPGTYTLTVLSPGYHRLVLENVAITAAGSHIAIELDQR